MSNFVYYNHEEIEHLCKTLYRKYIHHIISNNLDLYKNETPIKEIEKKTRFYHLGNPGESSAFILYFFRQVNGLPVNRFVSKLNTLEKSIENIVFIDDVALSHGDNQVKAKIKHINILINY